MALNSFENRVYDVEVETDEPISQPHLPTNRRVVKFYRPGRWTENQILEEHAFLADLIQAEIPAIAPLAFPDGSTLQKTANSEIYYALFPKVGGRAPQELTDEQLVRVGRLMGRVHGIGAAKEASARVRISPETYGQSNLDYLLKNNHIPIEFQGHYKDSVEEICQITRPWFQSARYQRIHGDCHFGNLLWNNAGPFFLDFDDMVIGPPVQDIWLLTPGRDQEAIHQRRVLISAYEEMAHFDLSTLRLIEPLRALRFIHYSAWIARRWDDPAFPAAFPHFGSHQYWQDELRNMQEQLRLIRGLTEHHH